MWVRRVFVLAFYSHENKVFFMAVFALPQSFFVAVQVYSSMWVLTLTNYFVTTCPIKITMFANIIYKAIYSLMGAR